jgi:hypothetical protein
VQSHPIAQERHVRAWRELDLRAQELSIASEAVEARALQSLAIREVTVASKKKKSKKKYGAAAQKKVGKAMHERKHGTLRSGRSGKKVKSKKQAIAIGLSEARARGAKVPRKKKGSKKKSRARA